MNSLDFNSLIEVNETTGELFAYLGEDLTAEAYDGEIIYIGVSDGSNDLSIPIVLKIKADPLPPEIVIVTLELSEDAEIGTLAGTILVADPQGGEVDVTFEGYDFFKLENGNEIIPDAELDFESSPSHDIEVTAVNKDGLSSTKRSVVNVVDVPNATYTDDSLLPSLICSMKH